ncbi:MAG TPA: M23 family metallopeptidase, partial [Candidatus Tectomicrobia bacterium]|nr:M23 family metallopeptidase [Candidatus Tectomicrobia bacterium]
MPSRSRSRFPLLLVVLLVLGVIGGVSYLGWRQSVDVPRVTLHPPAALGLSTKVPLVVEAARGSLTRVQVRLVQGGRPLTLVNQEGGLGPRVEIPLTLEGVRPELKEGSATLEVWARDDFWRPLRPTDRALVAAPVTIDVTPPRVEILAATRYISPGGAALVAFRAPDAARVSVTVGGRTFPSFAWGPPDRQARIALVALPHDLAPDAPLAVTAADEAGNTATRGVPATFKPRAFPKDTIQVSDALLQAKVPELLPQRRPDEPLIEGFLVINRDQRRQAEEEKRKIGAQTADRPLWQGPFTQPRNTKVFSNFAETRTYVYQGKTVDTQVHFGFDLASTRQSPVPAANAGRVVFAGPLTIYGNTVVLDHGLGLQTLYAHLSTIDVKVGDSVEKGQPLGRTGTTGLAIGDHLHFEVLVSGVSVTPLEWWDAKWIRDRVATPLAEAG